MVNLFGSRCIWPAHVGCSSIKTVKKDPWIVWMISGMIEVVVAKRGGAAVAVF
jgi:hypothetical protein